MLVVVCFSTVVVSGQNPAAVKPKTDPAEMARQKAEYEAEVKAVFREIDEKYKDKDFNELNIAAGKALKELNQKYADYLAWQEMMNELEEKVVAAVHVLIPLSHPCRNDRREQYDQATLTGMRKLISNGGDVNKTFLKEVMDQMKTEGLLTRGIIQDGICWELERDGKNWRKVGDKEVEILVEEFILNGWSDMLLRRAILAFAKLGVFDIDPDVLRHTLSPSENVRMACAFYLNLSQAEKPKNYDSALVKMIESSNVQKYHELWVKAQGLPDPIISSKDSDPTHIGSGVCAALLLLRDSSSPQAHAKAKDFLLNVNTARTPNPELQSAYPLERLSSNPDAVKKLFQSLQKGDPVESVKKTLVEILPSLIQSQVRQ